MTDLHPFLAALHEAGHYQPAQHPGGAGSAAGNAAGNGHPQPDHPAPPADDPQAHRYATAALEHEANTAATTPEGGRNHALNKAAFRVGQLTAHGWLHHHHARDTLIDAGITAGLSRAEATATVDSGLAAGHDNPRHGIQLARPVDPAHVLYPGRDEAPSGDSQGASGARGMPPMRRPAGGSPATNGVAMADPQDPPAEGSSGDPAGAGWLRRGLETRPPGGVAPDDSGWGAAPPRGPHQAGEDAARAAGAAAGHPPGGVAPDDSPEAQPWPRQAIDGASYILHASHTVPAIWGEHDDVLWAAGEPCLLTGPTGVGKTTLGTMLIAGRLGLIPDALGYPIAPGRRVLVLAMDRPRQIQRAMARLLRHHDPDVLANQLVVWQGPPPADLGKHPQMLHAMAQRFGADTIVIDSLKDAALKLSDEETGQGLSRAMNYCVTNGVEILAYHHQTKRTASGQGKPNSLADVYGSSWITAGAGSVILLWGNAGDLVVDLHHLKQPAAEVGPLAIRHDHDAGTSHLHDGETDKDRILTALSGGPNSPSAIASWLYGDAADRAAVQKVRRRLDGLVKAGLVTQIDTEPTRGGHASGQPGGSSGCRYQLAESSEELSNPRTGLSNSRILDARSRRTQCTPPVHRDQIMSPMSDSESVSAGPADARPNPQLVHGFDARTGWQNREHAGQADARSTHAPGRLDARPLPPLKGGEGGALPRVEGRPEVEHVCDKCYRQSDHLIPAPKGKFWCPACAYPQERHRTDET